MDHMCIHQLIELCMIIIGAATHILSMCSIQSCKMIITARESLGSYSNLDSWKFGGMIILKLIPLHMHNAVIPIIMLLYLSCVFALCSYAVILSMIVSNRM